MSRPVLVVPAELTAWGDDPVVDRRDQNQGLRVAKSYVFASAAMPCTLNRRAT